MIDWYKAVPLSESRYLAVPKIDAPPAGEVCVRRHKWSISLVVRTGGFESK